MGMDRDVKMWRPRGLDGVECLRAAFGKERFARHFHDGYALGVIEDGALGFKYLGRDEIAPAGSVNMAVPGEVHDGYAASPGGWRYRMFYLDADVAARAAGGLAGPGGEAADPPDFKGGVLHDPALAEDIAALHRLLETGAATLLERQERFADILAAWIGRHGEKGRVTRTGREPKAVRLAREYLDANAPLPVALADLCAVAGLSGNHLTRVFSLNVGMPPHAYQIMLRVKRARKLLAAGATPASAAAGAGFADQSHLTRHFARITGLTPGRYRKIVQDT
jgi:AraC-like DNA-binding protein